MSDDYAARVAEQRKKMALPESALHARIDASAYGPRTREALRALFEIDAPSIVLAALSALATRGEMAPTAVADAIRELGIDPEKADPLAL